MRMQCSSDIVVDELYLTANRLRAFVESRLREHGTSVARLRALRILARAEEPVRMRDLSDMLGVAARTATTVVDSLEREGLVERVRHPSDRRAFLLGLTEAGRERHREAEEIDRVALAEATARLTERDRGQLRELLARIREAVE